MPGSVFAAVTGHKVVLLEPFSRALTRVGPWSGGGAQGCRAEGLGSCRPGCEACLQYMHTNCGTLSSGAPFKCVFSFGITEDWMTY